MTHTLIPVNGRLRAAVMVAAVLGIAPHAHADVDVVRVAPGVSPWVNVRTAASVSGRKIDVLAPGATVPLIHDGPGWREVRRTDGTSGFVSAAHTVVMHQPDQPGPPPPQPSEPVVVIGRPDGPSLQVHVLPSGNWVNWPMVVALLSFVLAVYTGRQTNVRNRNETFRALRERFETFRAANRLPAAVSDGSLRLATTVARIQQIIAGVTVTPPVVPVSVEVTQLAKDLADLHKAVNPMRKYWIRAFDEWYITTGGRGVGRDPDGKWRARWWQAVGVYRVLWNEYYREVLEHTIRRHPGSLVVLWTAYVETKASLDLRFVNDMWDLADWETQNAAHRARDAWNVLADPPTVAGQPQGPPALLAALDSADPRGQTLTAIRLELLKWRVRTIPFLDTADTPRVNAPSPNTR